MRRGVLLIGVVVAGLCLVLLTVTGGGHRPASAPVSRIIAVDPGVALLNPDGSLRTRVPTSQIGQAYDALYRNGLFDVFDPGKPAITAIDAETGRVVRSVHAPTPAVGTFTFGRGVLWVTDERHGAVFALDPLDGHALSTLRNLPGSGAAEGVALAEGKLWVARPEALHGNGILAIVDPATGRLISQIAEQPGTFVLARDPDGSLWMGGAHGVVDHIDLPERNIGLIRLGGRNYSIAVDGHHHLWTTDTDTGAVYELNEQPAVIARYATASGADSVAYGEGAAWVGNSQTGTVTRITPDGRLRTYRFDHSVTSVAAGAGAVMVGFGKALREGG